MNCFYGILGNYVKKKKKFKIKTHVLMNILVFFTNQQWCD